MKHASVVTGGLKRRFKRIEFAIPVVEGNSLNNDYYDNDL
jgi:hypothetical protein